MAAPSPNKSHRANLTHSPDGRTGGPEPPPHGKEIITPSISELTKEVRTNILCTVEGCGKILPNTPALNMHLVKSHRVKEGLVNPTVRKDMKGSQRLYCCPMEGCPRGANRPFSQFSLVKQHFMKMHAEKKHKCVKCSGSYSTEWDLRRHADDCGRTYNCTCGCPYASRAALLSHTYRTGHELPKEHRYPPVKRRKMEQRSGSTKVQPEETPFDPVGTEKDLSEVAIPTEGACQAHTTIYTHTLAHTHTPSLSRKLLLPKPKVALLNVPVMQLAHLPVLIPPQADGGAVRSVVLALDAQGSLGTLQLLPPALGTMVTPALTAKAVGFRDAGTVLSRSAPDSVSTAVQVDLQSPGLGERSGEESGRQSKSTSTSNIQTDVSCQSRAAGGGAGPGAVTAAAEASVSSCSQTDISVSAQVRLPVSVQTQTFRSRYRTTSSSAAQTDASGPTPPLPFNITRETQTNCCHGAREDRNQMDQAIMCADPFYGDSLSVSTQTCLAHEPFLSGGAQDPLSGSGPGPVCFAAQTDILQQNPVADNQTQTMELFSDLEHILSHSMAAGDQAMADPATGCCGSGLGPVQEQHTEIDFDFEEFLNAAHIQTQTDESALDALGAETTLEQLDIQTQTDFLLLDNLGDCHHGDASSRMQQQQQQSSELELEMFDTQTQTDLNFLLEQSGRVGLGCILRHSSFNMSTESSDTETQTDASPPTHEGPVRLNSAETQTVGGSCDSLGLFLTSNETQTMMDDFLSADLAWNMESHLSSVETQTCQELFSLLHHSDKPNS